MHCTSCGAQVKDSAKFCPSCGQAIGNAPAAPAPPPPASAPQPDGYPPSPQGYAPQPGNYPLPPQTGGYPPPPQGVAQGMSQGGAYPPSPASAPQGYAPQTSGYPPPPQGAAQGMPHGAYLQIGYASGTPNYAQHFAQYGYPPTYSADNGWGPAGGIEGKIFFFKGRINRKKYWIASLLVTVAEWIILGILSIISAVSHSEGLSIIVGLLIFLVYIGVMIIGISLSIRRWHDLDKSGWWTLSNFLVLPAIYMAFAEGTRGPNQYGPDPLQTP